MAESEIAAGGTIDVRFAFAQPCHTMYTLSSHIKFSGFRGDTQVDIYITM